jgi:hypothetical protein
MKSLIASEVWGRWNCPFGLFYIERSVCTKEAAKKLELYRNISGPKSCTALDRGAIDSGKSYLG